MAAGPGDWAVREPDGDRWWSVRDDMFRAGHEHVEGSLWRKRTGFVRARQTHDSVIIDTLEGRALAAAAIGWCRAPTGTPGRSVRTSSPAGIRARDFGRPGTALVRRRVAPDRS